ncbi:hypothetical protein EJ05DRAFT_67500 [Pseudovirgaria hyperparasitica]|uniref:Zn(2)-C6 fungal-type domain-containing protein n=1 Tax=Pseudovirgaria hyperparasitica TaxID=470096 RepID=A0A6A6W3G2_9PEZI|nr:uncharacterized protein EJ05DRAFT_67500 [Pseudovirgaria hyperparasitica]KAF2756554.1 hypothetical protein EJ05DRAFT_67500 [Pseudovirgaria hyperparasitica]
MKKNNCELCRQRKIKCDREDPCSNCKKNGLECIFIDRPKLPRGRNGGRRSANDDLTARLRKLENMIASVAAARQSSGPGANQHAVPNAQKENSLPSQESKLDQYLGGSFWNSLASEVTEIRGLLQDPQIECDEEDEEDIPISDKTPSSPGRQNSVDLSTQNHFNFVLTGPGTFFVTPGLLNHPPQGVVDQMCTSFLTLVDPILKFVHAPSFRSCMQNHGGYMTYQQDHAGIEALKYATYFAAIAAETPEFSARVLGIDKKQALDRYRFCTEVALSKANFLDARDLITLQALIIYTYIIRVQELGKQQNSLSGTIVQLSRSFNLHLPAGYRNVSPFEAEMRRRLWSSVRMLDYYTAIDRGSEPLLLEDPKQESPRPHNINDEDFGPDSIDLPPEREGITDSSWTILCWQVLSHVKRMNYHAITVHPPKSKADWEQRFSFAREYERMCHEKLYPYLDLSNQHHFMLMLSARETIGVTKLFALRPLRKYPGATAPPVDNSYILELSLGILKESMASCETRGSPHQWWLWILWFALAVALAELCVRPDASDDVWDIVEKTYQHYSTRIADGKKGQLWQPIRRLRKRALSHRGPRQAIGSTVTFEPAASAQASISQTTPGLYYPSFNFNAHIPSTMQMPDSLQVWPRTDTENTVTQSDASMFATTQPIDPTRSNMPGMDPNLDMNDVGWNSWNTFVDDFMSFDQPY